MRHLPGLSRAAAIGFAALLTPALPAATIGDLAPGNCFLVASVADMAAARAALDRTRLLDFWNEPDVQRAVEAFKGEREDLGPWIEGADIDFESLSLPDVSLGFAMFIGASDVVAPGVPQDDAPAPQSLLLADYGEDVEAASDLYDAMLALFEEGEDLGEATIEMIDVGGVEAVRVVFDFEAIDERMTGDDAVQQDGMVDDEEFADDEWWAEQELGLADRQLPRTVLFAKVGAVVVAGTQRNAFEDALDRLAGADLGPTIGDSDTLRRTLAQHDSPHGWVAILIEPLLESLRGPHESPIAGLLEEMQPMFLDSLEWIEPAASSLGLDGLRALSAGVRLDSPSAMIETAVAALAPEKRGLWALFDGEPRPFHMPAVISPDAASVFSTRFNFDRVLPLVRSVGTSLPEPQRSAMLGQVDAFEQQLGPVFAALGSSLTFAKRIERPYSLMSSRTLVIAELRDRQAMIDALTGMAPMFGAESRDFLGTQIWESAFMPAFGVSVSTSGLLIGDPASIEAALREGADAARPKLASEDRFQQATRALQPGVAHYYADTSASAEYETWVLQNMDRLFAQQLDEMGVEEEFRQDFLDSMKASVPPWQRHMPGADVVLRYFGDTAAELRSTPDGIVYRMLQLRPDAQ